MTEKNASDTHRRDRLQVLANVLTIIVAVAAITLSVWEGIENRRHNRLSVLPHLERIESQQRDGLQDSTYLVELALKNSGLGPAVLHDMAIFRDGERIPFSDAADAYVPLRPITDDLDALSFPVSHFTHSRKRGEMLQSGETHLLLSLEFPIDQIEGRWTPQVIRDDVLDRYSYVFCYCSVYNENCKSVYLMTPPPEVNICRF